MLLGIIRSEEEEKARLFSSLYSKGLTTEQIGEISQEIYGRYYSKQQVSFLARGCKSEIDAWLLRSLSPRYLVVYLDATYVSTRREERVHQEAYYTMLGVLPNGTREVLGVVNHPSEGALNWKNELIALQERGVEQIDLIVSDALTGIETAVAEAFPSAEHQFCITHLKRSMGILSLPKKREIACGIWRKSSPLNKKATLWSDNLKNSVSSSPDGSVLSLVSAFRCTTQCGLFLVSELSATISSDDLHNQLD